MISTKATKTPPMIKSVVELIGEAVVAAVLEFCPMPNAEASPEI